MLTRIKFYLTPNRGWLVGTLKNQNGIISNLSIPEKCVRIDIVTIFLLESKRAARVDIFKKEDVSLNESERLIVRFGDCPIIDKKPKHFQQFT